jgi:2-phosphosulfolactate phosphatase
MGNGGTTRTDEDELCALHLRNRLDGLPGDAEAVRRVIRASREVLRPEHHPEDITIALDIDRFDFAIRVRLENGLPVARMERG